MTLPNPDIGFWDRAARKYAQSPIEDMVGYERSLARISAMLRPTDHVLELGCGTGSTALRLAPSAGTYVASDIAPEMIAIANEKLAEASIANLRFAAGTAADAPHHEGGYDVVLALNLLHLVEDLDQALAQIHALLRPNGLLVTKTALIAEMNLAIRLAIPLMRLIGKAPKNVRAFDEATFVDALKRAGFVIEAVERHGATKRDIRCFTVARRG